jgi:hypothetical protein
MKLSVSLHTFIIIACVQQLTLNCMEKEKAVSALKNFSELTTIQAATDPLVPLDSIEITVDNATGDQEIYNSAIQLIPQSRLQTIHNHWFALSRCKRALIKNVTTVALVAGTVATAVTLLQMPINNSQETAQLPLLSPNSSLFNMSSLNTTLPSQPPHPVVGFIVLKICGSLSIIGTSFALLGLGEYLFPNKQEISPMEQPTHQNQSEE